MRRRKSSVVEQRRGRSQQQRVEMDMDYPSPRRRRAGEDDEREVQEQWPDVDRPTDNVRHVHTTHWSTIHATSTVNVASVNHDI